MLRTCVYTTFFLSSVLLVGELVKDYAIDVPAVRFMVVPAVQAGALVVMIFALPMMYLLASSAEEEETAKEGEGMVRRGGVGVRRLVFSALSWIFYALCVAALVAVLLGGWKIVCSESYGAYTVVGVLAVVSFVFFVSSAQERKSDLGMFWTMKLMLVLVASLLAVLAEMSLVNRGNKRLAAIEGCLSAALFTIALFNTHGLGGRLMHNNLDSNRVRSRSRSSSAASAGSAASGTSSERSVSPSPVPTPDASPQRVRGNEGGADSDGDDSPDIDDDLEADEISHRPWSFWQPFVGGIKFVVLQIISWFFFGFSLVFGFVFVASCFTIGFEIFLGVMALAGACCVISEVLMIISLHVYVKTPEPLSPPLPPTPPAVAVASTAAAAAPVPATSLTTPPATPIRAKARSARAVAVSVADGPAFSTPWRTTPWSVVVRDLHALVVTVLIVNTQVRVCLCVRACVTSHHSAQRVPHSVPCCVVPVLLQYLPFLGILPVYFVAGLPLAQTIIHWFSACVCIGLYTLGFAYFKALQFNKRRPWAPPGTTGKAGRGGKKQSKKGSKAPPPSAAEAADPAHKIGAAFQTSHNAVLLAITCIPLAVTVYVATFEPRAVGPWIVVTVAHFLYVNLTYKGAPEITGCRELLRLKEQGPLIHYIGVTGTFLRSGGRGTLLLTTSTIPVRRYFGGTVIKEGELDPTKTYVLGFHPHGIVPITVFWLRCCDDHWQVLVRAVSDMLILPLQLLSIRFPLRAQELFPGVNFSMLTASVMHLVPLMRDLMQYMGGREVSRESFRHALRVSVKQRRRLCSSCLTSFSLSPRNLSHLVLSLSPRRPSGRAWSCPGGRWRCCTASRTRTTSWSSPSTAVSSAWR